MDVLVRGGWALAGPHRWRRIRPVGRRGMHCVLVGGLGRPASLGIVCLCRHSPAAAAAADVVNFSSTVSAVYCYARAIVWRPACLPSAAALGCMRAPVTRTRLSPGASDVCRRRFITAAVARN